MSNDRKSRRFIGELSGNYRGWQYYFIEIVRNITSAWVELSDKISWNSRTELKKTTVFIRQDKVDPEQSLKNTLILTKNDDFFDIS